MERATRRALRHAEPLPRARGPVDTTYGQLGGTQRRGGEYAQRSLRGPGEDGPGTLALT